MLHRLALWSMILSTGLVSNAFAHSALEIHCGDSAMKEVFSYSERDRSVKSFTVAGVDLQSGPVGVAPVLVINRDIPGLYLYQVTDVRTNTVVATIVARPSEMKETDSGGGSFAYWKKAFPGTLSVSSSLNLSTGKFSGSRGAAEFSTDDQTSLTPKASAAPIACTLSMEYA